MRQTSKVEGTKIAQAAKDLNVTSVTIRRYISEFNIETTSDENGIKVLPDTAMEELKDIRKLKEDGLTNPQVLEVLEEKRAKQKKSEAKGGSKAKGKAAKAQPEPAEDEEQEAPAAKKRPSRRAAKVEEEAEAEPDAEPQEADAPAPDEASADEPESTEGRIKHSLTCQTCGKVFEHMNPRLRDCLDCYRAKRKERRRGGAERHKNVIQHPLAQQAANRQAQAQQPQPSQAPQPVAAREKEVIAAPVERIMPASPAVPQMQRSVRNYRKAIEETRQITGSLKRRLERPDLPEGERRWLEQIYAYQLILHQGWRHLAEYKAATQQQGKSASDD